MLLPPSPLPTASSPQYITRPPDDKFYAATLNFVRSLENEALSVGPPVLKLDACLELTHAARGGLYHFVRVNSLLIFHAGLTKPR
jgi:hypothetical protein